MYFKKASLKKVKLPGAPVNCIKLVLKSLRGKGKKMAADCYFNTSQANYLKS